MAGTMFTGLSMGQHTLDLRFTPEGSTTPSLTQRVTFSVSADPTTCEHRNCIIGTIMSTLLLIEEWLSQ